MIFLNTEVYFLLFALAVLVRWFLKIIIVVRNPSIVSRLLKREAITGRTSNVINRNDIILL